MKINFAYIGLNLINKLVVSVLFTLSIFAEVSYLGQARQPSFYLIVLLSAFLVSVGLYKPVKNFFLKRSEEQEKSKKKKWSPLLLGPTRSFEPLQLANEGSRYPFEVDVSYISFTAVLFLGIHFFLVMLAESGLMGVGVLRDDVFLTAFIIFFSYSLVLLASFLLSYEAYLAKKKGRGELSSANIFAYIFFLLISFALLIRSLFSAYGIIFR